MDEILPLQDPRVQANPAYASIIILTRVIVSLGDLPEVTPQVLENMFASDLGYLQTLYRQINSPAILTEADISAESITDIENALTQELVAATS